MAGIGAFAHHVQLVVYGLVVISNHLERTQTLGRGPMPIGKTGNLVKQCQILIDYCLNSRPQHLDDDLAAVFERRAVNLRNRGRGQRLNIKALKVLRKWRLQ